MRKLRYVYDCTNPEDIDELNYILDNYWEIEREEFVDLVDPSDRENLERLLGYDLDFPIENDPYITYGRVEYQGNTICFLSWSAIEYVFK